jgi:hypothetical protein
LHTTQRRRHVRRTAAAAIAAAVASTLVGSGALLGAARANPGDGTPGGLTGAGTVTVTTPGPITEGSTITIQGSGFAAGTGGTWQTVSVKIDAVDNATYYKGSAILSPNGVVATFPLQSDGTFTGTLMIPPDIDDPTANPGNYAGPHWLRVLGSDPALSRWSNDFVTVDALATTPAGTSASDQAAAKVKQDKAAVKKLKKKYKLAHGAKKAALKKKLKKAKKQLKKDRAAAH